MQDEILHLSLNDIDVVSNTRTEFGGNGLKELAASIKTSGVIQPVVVKVGNKGKCRLICGERRLRASFIAGQPDIPARVVDIPDDEILVFQVVENLQRRSVSTMEEVRAIVRLRDENSMSYVEIAKAIGKHLSHVNAQMSIAKCEPEVQNALEKNYITRSVALLIAALDSPDKQLQAVKALKRENPAFTVKKSDAEIWINKTFSAQPKKPKYGRTPKSRGRFAVDWKYYLVRFSAEQFERWKDVVSNRTETDIFADAVEAVMNKQAEAAKV